jgi:hypothetical protein
VDDSAKNAEFLRYAEAVKIDLMNTTNKKSGFLTLGFLVALIVLIVVGVAVAVKMRQTTAPTAQNTDQTVATSPSAEAEASKTEETAQTSAPKPAKEVPVVVKNETQSAGSSKSAATPGYLTATIVDQHGKPYYIKGVSVDIEFIDAVGEYAVSAVQGNDGKIKNWKPLVPGKYKLVLPADGLIPTKGVLDSGWDCNCYPKISNEFTLPAGGIDVGKIEVRRFAKISYDMGEKKTGIFNEAGTEIYGNFKLVDWKINDADLAKGRGWYQRFSNLPSGTYTLEASAQGYETKKIPFEIKNDEDVNLGKIVLKKI